MRFLKQDKAYIAEHMISVFHLKKYRAYYFSTLLENAIFRKDPKLFYLMQYSLHFQNNPDYSRKVMYFAIDMSRYLLTQEQYKDMHDEFMSFIYQLFDAIFIQRCVYAQKIEQRNNTVQNILQHLSTRFNETLETQQLMIANISHEMRTSLNAILGYMTLLDEKNLLEGEDKTFLFKAINAGTTLRTLVSDILDLTKINAGQMEIKEEYFWIDEMVIKAIDSLSIELHKKASVDFQTEIGFFPMQVNGDYQHILEILTNLLSNAIKYTEKGTIHLSAKEEATDENNLSLHIQIKDSGIGMSPAQLKEIFNPFSRFETQKAGGVGLGMHIASKLAQQLNASLTVESTLGEGSTFDFIIPLKKNMSTHLELHGQTICFFCDQSTSYTFSQRIKFLKDLSADVISYQEENTFIEYLIQNKENIPDIVSITTDKDNYKKYDALINYLKTLPQYQESYFIAEMTSGELSLRHFDRIYDHFATLNTFTKKVHHTRFEKNMHTKSSAKIRILVVDDLETNLEIFHRFVSKRYPDFSIDLAAGGYEAIGMYKANAYTMIFLDLKMPGLSGFEVLKKLQDIRTPPPVFALTADVYKNIHEQIQDAGFAKLVEKPLQLGILFDTIEGVINAQNT